MIPSPYDAYVLFGILGVLFTAFVWEKIPNELAAALAVVVLIVVGILSPHDVFGVLSNEAPITVALMFVMSAALDRTGAIQSAGALVVRVSGRSPVLSLVMLMLGTMVASAFINNTPVVVILTPIAIMLATATQTPASKYLIPLSYAAILGGTCTLIGTSTNLIVAGVSREAGMAPFGIFDITPLGLVYGAIGLSYLALFGRHLLPNREIFAQLGNGSDERQRRFLADVLVPQGSPLVGKRADQLGVLSRLDVRLIDVIRNRVSIFQEERRQDLSIEAGDRLILRSTPQDLMTLRSRSDLVFSPQPEEGDGRQEHVLEPISGQDTQTVECIIGPESGFAGKRLGSLNLRRQYGIYVLAVHRHGENIGPRLDRLRLEFGDRLLLEGPPEAIKQLADMDALIPLAPRHRHTPHRGRQPIAIGIFLGLIAVTTMGLLPFATAALIAAILLVATRCLTVDEAYRSISWPILSLIFAMLAIGKAIHSTGADDQIVTMLLYLAEGQSPLIILSLFYFVTMLLTEFVSNNATAIIITPIAITLSHTLGLNPEPFIVAVMFAASASFATPIGYQTNTFVYAAGGYRFVEFVKVGLPLNLLLWMTATFLIPQFFPLLPPT